MKYRYVDLRFCSPGCAGEIEKRWVFWLKLFFVGLILVFFAIVLLKKDFFLQDFKHCLALSCSFLVILVPVAKIAFNMSFSFGLLILFVLAILVSILGIKDDYGKKFAFGFSMSLGLVQLLNYLVGFIIGSNSQIAESYLLLFDQTWLVVLITGVFSLIVGICRPDDPLEEDDDLAIFHPEM